MNRDSSFNSALFEEKLRATLNRLVPAESTLKKAMGYSLLSPGKRIRPQLVYETANRLGLSDQLADPVAIAVEMVHAFSLIHDDLPCMDDDDFRRGLPTNHKVFGEPVALLAGDALLTHALAQFSELATRVNPSVFAQASQYFYSCIGADGIMGGQSAELELNQSTLEDVLKVQDMKTTALFRATILIPVLLAGYSPEHSEFQNHLDFANAFGFAFQAADDLEDASQDKAAHQTSKNLLAFLSPEELRSKAKRQLFDSKISQSSLYANWLLARL